MAKLKTIALVLASNKQIDIPIWCKKAEFNEKCHIDNVQKNYKFENLLISSSEKLNYISMMIEQEYKTY